MSEFTSVTINGVPIFPQANMFPILGKAYLVDGTYGSTSAPGTVEEPLSTIQAAVTLQISETQGRGDVIYIAPGTYAEAVVASELTNVKLIGYSADAVIIAPTDASALIVGTDAAGGSTSTTMTNALIKGITFLTPSTSNPTLAALNVCYMTKSVIEDCKFKGTTTTGFEGSRTMGLQIGNPTDTEWEFHEHSRISRCEFTTNGGREKELGVGIIVGVHGTGQPSYKGFKSMIIEDCIISAYGEAIDLNTDSSSCGGSVIRRNTITSHQGGAGPDHGIISRGADVDPLCMILDNRIKAISDGITNFHTSNVTGNMVSISGGTPADETWI